VRRCPESARAGQPERLGGEPVPDVVTAAATIGLAVLLVLGSADRWLIGSPAQAAQRMRYPDGSHPAGGWFEGPSHRHPWSVSPQPTGPSVEEVRSAWRRVTGRDLDDQSVVVTSRADLLATTPIHPFLTWKSIYSHPAGRFEDRLRLLERVGSCTTPQCAWRLLRHNDLDRVDGLVLAVTSEGLRLTVTTDTFPDAWTTRPIIFDPALLTAPYFRRADVRGVAVVEVVADPDR
jgi:galactan 5-O-arabinofuranosyltransferase